MAYCRIVETVVRPEVLLLLKDFWRVKCPERCFGKPSGNEGVGLESAFGDSKIRDGLRDVVCILL